MSNIVEGGMMEEKQKDLLDQYLEKSSSILDKSYLDTENESKYLDKFNKTDGSDRTSYLDRLNDPEAKHEKSYLDRLNDPEQKSEKGYLETIKFDYLNQDTTIQDIKIDYGYLVKNDTTIKKQQVATNENEIAVPGARETEPAVENETPEQATVAAKETVVDESKIIDHKPQLPSSVWYLSEGVQALHSGVKVFSQWQPQPFRGTGKLRKIWQVNLEGDPSQLWPIVTMNTWFLGPYTKIDPETGETRQLKTPLIPELTDGYRIIGAMKLDSDWWRVALDLDTAEFSGKVFPASKPRGSFKAINRSLLYLDAREGEGPFLARLNPENFSTLWKLESVGTNPIVNAGVAMGGLWIFQQGKDSLFTHIDPVKGIHTGYTLEGYHLRDCFDFWGKLFLTTSDGLLLEYALDMKKAIKEIPLGLKGWTTTFMHANEELTFVKSTDGRKTVHFAVDPLSGEARELSVPPRKDGSYYFPDGRYFRKMDFKSNETTWLIDDKYVTSVLLEDERGILTRAGNTVALWS